MALVLVLQATQVVELLEITGHQALANATKNLLRPKMLTGVPPQTTADQGLKIHLTPTATLEAPAIIRATQPDQHQAKHGVAVYLREKQLSQEREAGRLNLILKEGGVASMTIAAPQLHQTMLRARVGQQCMKNQPPEEHLRASREMLRFHKPGKPFLHRECINMTVVAQDRNSQLIPAPQKKDNNHKVCVRPKKGNSPHKQIGSHSLTLLPDTRSHKAAKNIPILHIAM